MTERDSVLVTKEEYICTVTISRPEKLNKLTDDTLLRLSEVLQSVNDEGKTRVVVLRGTGEQAFSSGYDIAHRSKGKDIRLHTSVDEVVQTIGACSFPVIAMIYGYCVGGGLGLAVACDLRLAADNARLGITPAKLGVVYGAIGIQQFVNVVGLPMTKELFYTGRLINAEQAKEIRLVNHVVPANQLVTFTYEMAREIANNAPFSVRGTKITISKLLSYQKLSPQDREELLELRRQATDSEDRREGRRAFFEKRKPVFKGR